MTVEIGTSGWQYKSWKNAFYGGQPQRAWLDGYVEAFATVEINNAFYRLPSRQQFETWAQRTPDDFVIAVKTSRYLTHIKRLKDPEEPVKRFMDAIEGLGKQLGPVLLQLPPSFRIDLDRLESTLRLFPGHVRVCVEPRHDSWFVDETRQLLEHHNAALCLADRSGPITPLWRTANWGYIRFHEGRATPNPCYGRQSLAPWAERIADMYDDGTDVFAYFNNDTNVCAPRDAGVFAEEIRRVGRTPSRVPDHHQITPTTDD